MNTTLAIFAVVAALGLATAMLVAIPTIQQAQAQPTGVPPSNPGGSCDRNANVPLHSPRCH